MARVNLDQSKVLLTAQRAGLKTVQPTTRQVLVGARRLAPRGSHLSGSGKRHPGKVLSTSLQANIRVGVEAVVGRVGSRAAHAATVALGSKPHVIVGKGKRLKFRWDRGEFALRQRGAGRFFYFRRVLHPGNKRAVRYLQTPLIQFGTANGYKVSDVGRFRTRPLP